MATLRNTAIRWYRKVFGAPAGSDIREQGLATVLDGNTAVTLSEAGIATHAVLGGTAPMHTADAVWLGEVAHGTNLFGQALAAQTAEGPRGIVAAATGIGLAGCRATAFLSGPDLAASQDLLISAAGKHVPLVLHVGARSAAAHGSAPGTGHETVHLGADSGFCVLFAANVQQAVDFTYVARRVAEETLVPVMVVMDGEQTALAAQDVRLLSPAQVDALLGAPEDRIDAPTEAQKLLFGDTRRRVPAWHDLDEPVLTGALFDTNSYALGALARGPFFDSFVGTSLNTALKAFESKTGRRNETVSRYRLKDATTVLIAQGSAVETACCAADHIRKHHKVKVGVLGIHVLRPFPATEIAAALNGRQHVFVLERVNAPLAEDPPLSRYGFPTSSNCVRERTFRKQCRCSSAYLSTIRRPGNRNGKCCLTRCAAHTRKSPRVVYARRPKSPQTLCPTRPRLRYGERTASSDGRSWKRPPRCCTNSKKVACAAGRPLPGTAGARFVRTGSSSAMTACRIPGTASLPTPPWTPIATRSA
jgi:pyruvate-ferredoxin/flavodoxin oxidoreductase